MNHNHPEEIAHNRPRVPLPVKHVRFATDPTPELPDLDTEDHAPTFDDQWEEMSEDERAKWRDDHGPGLY